MSKLPGPTMDTPPGAKPSAGITRVDLERGFGSQPVACPETMANTGMDTDYPTEGRRRKINGGNH